MTIRTESRITVAGSVGDVWAYMFDVGRWPEWAPTVLECRVRGGGILRPGAWVEQRAKDLGWNHTNAMMWVEVDLANIMRVIPGRALQGQIQRVSNIEMAAIRAAVESDLQAGAGSP